MIKNRILLYYNNSLYFILRSDNIYEDSSLTQLNYTAKTNGFIMRLSDSLKKITRCEMDKCIYLGIINFSSSFDKNRINNACLLYYNVYFSKSRFLFIL